MQLAVRDVVQQLELWCGMHVCIVGIRACETVKTQDGCLDKNTQDSLPN